jgi:hypothetical protein
MDNLEIVPEGETLMAYRLGRVERSLEELNRKLDSIADIRTQVLTNSLKITSLEKSRDRLIAGVSVIGTGVIMLSLQTLFDIIGK